VTFGVVLSNMVILVFEIDDNVVLLLSTVEGATPGHAFVLLKRFSPKTFTPGRK
jgi:hypothetical protein